MSARPLPGTFGTRRVRDENLSLRRSANGFVQRCFVSRICVDGLLVRSPHTGRAVGKCQVRRGRARSRCAYDPIELSIAVCIIGFSSVGRGGARRTRSSYSERRSCGGEQNNKISVSNTCSQYKRRNENKKQYATSEEIGRTNWVRARVLDSFGLPLGPPLFVTTRTTNVRYKLSFEFRCRRP